MATWTKTSEPPAKVWSPGEDLFVLWDPLGGVETLARVDVQGSSGNLLDVDVNGAAKVLLNGSNVQPSVSLLTTTPLAAGASFSSSVRDLTAAPGANSIALMAYADTIIVVQWFNRDPSGHERLGIQVAFPANKLILIRPFRPTTTHGYWKVTNRSSSAQTTLEVRELLYADLHPIVQNQFCVLAYNLQIRDIGAHWSETDPNAVFDLVRSDAGGGKIPIYVHNGLNQAVDVKVELGPLDADFTTLTLGAISVPAASFKLITNADFPGIDVPSERVRTTLICATAPTSGGVYAYADNSSGGAA